MDNTKTTSGLTDLNPESPLENLVAALEKVKLGFVTDEDEPASLFLCESQITVVDIHLRSLPSSLENTASFTKSLVNAITGWFRREQESDFSERVLMELYERLKLTATFVGEENLESDREEIEKTISKLDEIVLVDQNNLDIVLESIRAKAISRAYQDGFKKPIIHWNIELKFEIHPRSSHKPLEFIFLFIEVLNNSEGVEARLDEIIVGSIWARVKILFSSQEAKDGLKELLSSVRKMALGKMTKEYSEGENNDANRAKLNIETQLLAQELQKANSPEKAELVNLELQKKHLELEILKLEVNEKKLSHLKKSMDFYKELLAEGLLSQDQYKILINDIPFLKMNNGNLEIGADMEDMEQ